MSNYACGTKYKLCGYARAECMCMAVARRTFSTYLMLLHRSPLVKKQALNASVILYPGSESVLLSESTFFFPIKRRELLLN